MREINYCVKRIVDIFGSLMGVVVISPILIFIAITIKLTSNGPVFFKQERLGLGGRKFQIFKFRTMVLNAEFLGDGIRVSNDHDSRITKVGRMLRATSLDELPQLLNVITGEMSLVGPRPPVTYHPYKGYDEYPEWAKPRFKMRPGITGLAQVKVRNSVSWEEKIQIDICYVEKFNLWLDFKILLRTVKKVFCREGIYIKNEDSRTTSSL